MNRFAIVETAIRQLHARYADAVWRQDVAGFAACFAADGEWHIAGQHLRGHAEIGAALRRFLHASQRVLIVTGQPVVALGSDGATAHTPLLEFVKLASGDGAMTIGAYDDHYVHTADGWRFRRRIFTLRYRGPPDLSAAFTPSNDPVPTSA